jgi:hypothetical protein
MGSFIDRPQHILFNCGDAMRQLPKARIVRISASQKRALVRWLNEWRIDRLLREDGPGRSATGSQGPQAASKASGLLYDVKPVRVGQIRLFHPFTDETAVRPRYVAVLKENGDGSWLAAPFSRFAEPAVPGEWKTGRDVPVLRSLCIWNARSLPDSVLARSWDVDRMTISRITQAVAIHKLLAEGKELSRPLSRRVGPPLVHPLDPRIEYMEEEREWFSALSAKRPAGKLIDSLYTPLEDSDRSLPLAAEERGKYKSSRSRNRKPRGHQRDT